MNPISRRKALALAVLALLAHPAAADDNPLHFGAPEGHAPIMVMGDHRHKAGEIMVSLRHSQMRMSGNIKGTKKLSDADVLNETNEYGMPAGLRVVPQKMTMRMTMLGAMYAPSDRVTFLAMLMHMDNEMTLDTYQGMAGMTRLAGFTTRSEGMGDTTLGALIAGGDTMRGAWHYGLALSVPTGAIDKTARVLTPMNMQAEKRLPYPMQLGSGSYDLNPSLTYNGDWGGWRVGAQAAAVLRLTENDMHYRLGDKIDMQGWAMKRLSHAVSASLRFQAGHQDTLRGGDAAIALPVPTAQTRSQGGSYANLAIGINLIAHKGVLAGHRLALEWVKPVYQNAEGVQMQRDETLMLGWQKAF